MHSSVPKQFMTLGDEPVICHSIRQFEQFSGIGDIVLVTDEEDVEFCRDEIVAKYGFRKVRAVIAGGEERYDSVYAGLKWLKESGREYTYIMIHDGARPLIDQELLRRNLKDAEEYGNAVSGMPSKDTIKICTPSGMVLDTPERRNLWQVQTPQTFRFEQACSAYEKLYELRLENITDDAMVVEKVLGEPVHMTEGSYRNIKITTPEDMIIAEALLKT
jgi:2-C-methyl-D-erythritol 4-phosphate cytidylyltransferase